MDPLSEPRAGQVNFVEPAPAITASQVAALRMKSRRVIEWLISFTYFKFETLEVF
jgi:hypothetical protein